MIDFTEAEIGQEVWHPMHGNGEITSINSKSNYYVINVEFHNKQSESFTKNGRVTLDDVYPTLCVGHKDATPIKQGKLPVKRKKLKFTGSPVWAYVSECISFNEEKEFYKKRKVIAYCDEVGYLAIMCGRDNTLSVNASIWKYAWEIEK